MLQVQDTDTVGDLVSVSLVGWLSCKSVCDFPVCAARREVVGRVRLCSKTRNSNVTRVKHGRASRLKSVTGKVCFRKVPKVQKMMSRAINISTFRL